MAMIEVSQEEYDQLIEDRKLLQALQAAGVENWEGYDFAHESLND